MINRLFKGNSNAEEQIAQQFNEREMGEQYMQETVKQETANQKTAQQERAEIDAQIRQLTERKKELGKESRREKNTEWNEGALVGKYARLNPTINLGTYRELIASQGFDKFLTKNSDREKFGFPPLPENKEPTGEKTHSV